MKLSWNWLKRFIDLNGVDPNDVADRYTMSVAELEGMEAVGTGLDDVMAMRIEDVRPVEGAGKLNHVRVWTGREYVSGVSSAPNLQKGLVVAGALPGARLPGGVEVRRSVIKGVESAVLLLSEKEMDLTDDHSGVMVVQAMEPGTKLAQAMDWVDYIFEIDNKSVTHRPDLWGHEGVAREVAVLTGRKFVLPEYPLPVEGPDTLQVSVQDAADCPRYIAAGFSGVLIRPSPFWMRYALFKVGLRSINNVVDITNFVMLDTGNPMHAFDRRFLRGDRIEVRRARPGERMATLDGVGHELTAEDIVIADAQGPVALAGVMGGENSQIRDDTTDIVLEAANFHPAQIRRTAIRHNCRTDSSARFEKSLDPHQAQRAAGLFSQLLQELSPGATRSSRLYDIRGFSEKKTVVTITMDYINQRLGVEVPQTDAVRILTGLGFGVREDQGTLHVDVPTFRATKDIGIPEDIVEEVGRLWGYDKIEPQAPPIRSRVVPRLRTTELTGRAGRVLRLNCGMDEVKTYSFYDNEFNALFEFSPDDALGLKNPASRVMDRLRTSMVPNLLAVAVKNAGHKGRFGVFESGRVFFNRHTPEGIPEQPRRLGLLIYDKDARDIRAKEQVLLQVKGAVQQVMEQWGLGRTGLEAAVEAEWPWLHPNARAGIQCDARDLGYYGLVHPFVLQKLGLRGTAAVAEIDVDGAAGLEAQYGMYTRISKFPGVEMDLSVIVADAVNVGRIRDAITRAAGALLAGIELVAVYRGAPIEPGKKSVTYHFLLQAQDHTLSDAETSAVLDRAITEAEAMGGEVKRG